MSYDGIIPDILGEVPKNHITLSYPSMGKKVAFAQNLSPNYILEEPKVEWKTTSGKFYTLLLFGPDTPSKKYSFVSNVNMWLVGNIQGCDLSTGEVIAEYGKTSPPKRSGPHRYIFVVFEHTQKIVFDETKLSKNVLVPRLKFSLKNFREKYNLGNVHAWTYFIGQWKPEDEGYNTESSYCAYL